MVRSRPHIGICICGAGSSASSSAGRARRAWKTRARYNPKAAYDQLLQYREDLGNPPLLVVCDLDRFQVHTNFTGTTKRIHEFTLDELDRPEHLRVLHAVFADPGSLRPEQTVEAVTEEAAARFGALAASLHARGYAPPRIAHFLVQLLFALFAEDVGLLPKGIVGELLRFTAKHPERFPAQAAALFAAMRDGGDFSMRDIAHFNGGLFAVVDPLPLTAAELDGLAKASALDWGSVEPAIFGTLFERSLDPAKRAQLGAHYTGKADIERVVDPVVMTPLRRRWDLVRADADKLKSAWQDAKTPQTRDNRRAAFAAALFAFQEELAAVKILDPACGSGNFLYVALARLKDLEKEVVAYGTANGLPAMLPRVGPKQLYGLEINEYAHELAQVVVWIGYLQWMRDNGFQLNRDPVLEPLETIRLQDALLDLSDPAHPKEAQWPPADFIIGNPPFLGVRKLRGSSGDEYVEQLWQVFADRVPREADLIVYFFERAREEIEGGRAKRAGLLATQSIRRGKNRRVLDRIKQSGDIFMAWDDEPWVLDGAEVRISIVGFDNGAEAVKTLDGVPVATINTDLTTDVDVTTARELVENRGICFQGGIKGGPFEISSELAHEWLRAPLNPNGRPNSDVLAPWVNGIDLTRRARGMWIIDFGLARSEDEAAFYELPFEYVKAHVKPERDKNRRDRRRLYWWIHSETHPAMRAAILGLPRFLCTPRVAKHRVFVWVDAGTLPDTRVYAFGRDDDYFFGVLQSRVHELWSLRQASRHGVGNDPTYNTTSCFETFPFPGPTDDQHDGVSAAAQALDEQRRRWLNPADADDATLGTRTLTNLYNQRPAWLANAHARLDRAVWAAYGWPDPDPSAVDDNVILTRLLALNHGRAAP